MANVAFSPGGGYIGVSRDGVELIGPAGETLARIEKRPDGARKATILKHRSIEEGRSARFRIVGHFRLVDGGTPAATGGGG